MILSIQWFGGFAVLNFVTPSFTGGVRKEWVQQSYCLRSKNRISSRFQIGTWLLLGFIVPHHRSRKVHSKELTHFLIEERYTMRGWKILHYHFWPQRYSSEGYWSPLQLFSFCSEVFRIFGNYFEVFWCFWNYFEVFWILLELFWTFLNFIGSILKEDGTLHGKGLRNHLPNGAIFPDWFSSQLFLPSHKRCMSWCQTILGLNWPPLGAAKEEAEDVQLCVSKGMGRTNRSDPRGW